MADNTTLDAGSGGDTIRTDENTGNNVKTPVSKIELGVDGSFDGLVAATNPLPIAANTSKDGSGTVYAPLVDSDGHLQVDLLNTTLAVTQSGNWSVRAQDGSGTALTSTTVGADQSLDVNLTQSVALDASAATVTVDNGGTFVVQVDGTALTRLTDIETNTDFGATTGGGTEAGALRVTVANDSTGVLSVDDNGGSLTVDGTVTADAGSGTFTVTDDGSFTLAASDGTDIGDVGIKDVAGTVSSNNSSTSTLTSGSTFTGTGEDVSGYASVKVSAFSDQDSASAGMKLEFSSDNSNWDISYTYDLTGGTAFVAEVGPEAQYFRVRYTNGGTGQSSFRLQTIFHPVPTQHLGVPVGSAISNEDNAQLTKAVITADVGGGNYEDIQATNGGNLKVVVEEIAEQTPDMNTGNAGAGTQRVVLATDQPALDVSSATVTVTDNGSFTLAANDGVDIGDVDVASQPARDRTTDNMGVALQTDALMDDTTALTPKFAAIDAASSGDNTIVSAVAGKKIRVLALFLVAAGDVVVRFEDGAAGSALTGQMNLTTNSGFVLPQNTLGWFETSANTLLNLELDSATSVDGSLTYVEV